MAKPYFEAGGVAIYHGDCREIVPGLGQFDLVCADPPYGETALDWDTFCRGWLGACASVSSSLWSFGSLQFFMDLASSGELSGWRRSQEIIWEKHNGSSFHADRFRRVHEIAAHFYKGEWSAVYKQPVKVNDSQARRCRRKARPPHMGNVGSSEFVSVDGGPRLMTSVIFCRSAHGQAQHPTQKPIGILTPLIAYGCPSGGRILDPFAGSGSSLVAAKQMGVAAVGVEIDERHCEVAAKRLSQETLEFGESFAIG